MPRLATQPEIRDWCIRHIARTQRRRAAEIDPAERFPRLGLDSATMINLIVAVEEWLGIEIAPESVFEYRNINELSLYLAGLTQDPN